MGVTLKELRERAEALTENEASNYIEPATWARWISEAYAELYNELVTSGIIKTQKRVTITGTGASLYDLPDDFFGLVSVSRIQGGYYYPLDPFTEATRHDMEGFSSNYAYCYLVVDDTRLELLPAPSGHDYRLIYIPKPKTLKDDDDEIETMSGFEKLIILDVAIAARERENGDTQSLEARRERYVDRLRAMSQARNWGEAQTIQDTLYGEEKRMPGDYLRKGVRDL